MCSGPPRGRSAGSAAATSTAITPSKRTCKAVIRVSGARTGCGGRSAGARRASAGPGVRPWGVSGAISAAWRVEAEVSSQATGGSGQASGNEGEKRFARQRQMGRSSNDVATHAIRASVYILEVILVFYS
jgi:hypothetical protein